MKQVPEVVYNASHNSKVALVIHFPISCWLSTNKHQQMIIIKVVLKCSCTKPICQHVCYDHVITINILQQPWQIFSKT